MLTHAFTCTGSYAILILLGIKRVENRGTRPVAPKGRCAISCSKSFCKEEFGNFVQWASVALPAELFELIPSWRDVKDWPGKIIGSCEYSVRERSDAKEPWDEGLRYWWDLSDVVMYENPIPCRGNLGMWEMPPSVAAQVTVADARARARESRSVAAAADATNFSGTDKEGRSANGFNAKQNSETKNSETEKQNPLPR